MDVLVYTLKHFDVHSCVLKIITTQIPWKIKMTSTGEYFLRTFWESRKINF